MANYGFVIDLTRCIGCHACTIACKSEHDVPIGVNRCWVKTVEKGRFPEVRRSFFPVLCNQCTDAPCMKICPTSALYKRNDGIVDLHSDSCIGCRACMQACPYDQLFIDPNTHTAEKCNFCANRVENQLEPSCVSVCPTQCRIFGDLDDDSSEVARILDAEPHTVRKPEKGTGPRVFYLGADDSVLRPEIASRPLFYKEGDVHLRPVAAPTPDLDQPGAPRVDYDVPHAKPWGLDVTLYLLTKGIAAGALALSAVLWLIGYRDALTMVAGPVVALVFNLATAGLLIADLERPERFYYILTRSNWRSWLVLGAYCLAAHGALAAAWLAAAWFGLDTVLSLLVVPAVVASMAATAYTGFLFAQGHGRDLWQGPYAAVDLLAQAAVEGAGVLLLLAPLVPATPGVATALGGVLAAALSAHLLMLVFEYVIAPSPTLHHELAVRAIRHGAYARWFWTGAIVMGGALPLVILAVALTADAAPVWPLALAALLALGGATAWEFVWVEAGQSVPLS